MKVLYGISSVLFFLVYLYLMWEGVAVSDRITVLLFAMYFGIVSEIKK